MGRVALITFAFLLFAFVISPQVSAQNYKQMVLGDSTEASELTFPQISAGPGVITPDSPLYFIDKAYQTFRIALASPQDKAKIRAAIAGERLAELRLMMAENDEKGINTALNEMTFEMDKAAESLNSAAGKNGNVEGTAEEVNQKLKEQRFALKSLILQAKGDLRLKLLAANASLKEAKVEVEGKLPEEHLINEIEDDLAETIEEESSMATESARRLEYAVSQMDRLATIAGERDLERLETDNKNLDAAVMRKKQQLMELKKRRLNEIKLKREQAVKEFREKAEEAGIQIKQAEEEKNLLDLEEPTPTETISR